MSDKPYSGHPWSNNPNAPQIPYSLYFAEKANFAGLLIGAIFYGMRTYTPTYAYSLFLFDVPF
jgi:hypothetical protein